MCIVVFHHVVVVCVSEWNFICGLWDGWVMFTLLSGMWRGRNPSSHFLDWLVHYETKSTFTSFWKTTTNTFLCLLFLSVSDTVNLESARHYCRDYLPLRCINCKDLCVIFLYCSSIFMSISCAVIQFSPFQPNKMYVAGHSRILVKICSLSKPVCYLQLIMRWLLIET
jgi:hypothetical protein